MQHTLGKSRVLLILETELHDEFGQELHILPQEKITEKIDAILETIKDGLIQHFKHIELAENVLSQQSQFFHQPKHIRDVFVSFKKHIEVEIDECIEKMLAETKKELINGIEQMKDPKYTSTNEGKRRERFPVGSVQPLKGTDII